MRRVKIYANEFRIIIPVFGYVALCLLAIIFSANHNEKINDIEFIIWFTMLIAWYRASYYVCNRVIKRYQIPDDELDKRYADAMKMPDGIVKYKALHTYHMLCENIAINKMDNHYLGFNAIRSLEKTAATHHEKCDELNSKIIAENLKHNKH